MGGHRYGDSSERSSDVLIEESDQPGWLWVETPYHPGFVDALKAEIPSWGRRWDPQERAWRVRFEFQDTAEELCGEYFGTTEREPERKPETGLAIPEHYRLLFLLPDAPQEVVKAVYRAMVLLKHPDRGGTHDGMVAINRSFEKIRRERGWG